MSRPLRHNQQDPGSHPLAPPPPDRLGVGPGQLDPNRDDYLQSLFGGLDLAPVRAEVSEIILGDEPDEASPAPAHGVGIFDLGIDWPDTAGEPPAPEADTMPVHSADLSLVEARVLLERPFFALARRPVPRLPAYTDPTGRLNLQVTAADPARGVATLADADILIVLTSLMNANRGAGGRVEAQVCLPASTWLRLSRRQTGGRQRRLLAEALDRLRETCITTNIGPTGEPGPMRGFSLLAGWSQQGRKGLTLTAGDWLVEAVEAGALLSLTEGYFDLPLGYARWLYRTARKHAGRQAGGYRAYDRTLWRKSGATGTLAHFRTELKRLVLADALPDYRLTWIPGGLARDPQIWMRPDTKGKRDGVKLTAQRRAARGTSRI